MKCFTDQLMISEKFALCSEDTLQITETGDRKIKDYVQL